MASSRPFSIAGGCLCGAVRFTILFSEAAEWPPRGNGTCQCTMCRKFCGSLVTQNFNVPTANITPPLSTQPAFKTYNSSSTANRGFCGTCGSSLTFNYSKKPEETEIHLGALDEDVLCGQRVEIGDRVWKDELGKHIARDGGYGSELAYTERHIWVENAVPGVTDRLPGKKWLTDESGGQAFEGTLEDLKKK